MAAPAAPAAELWPMWVVGELRCLLVALYILNAPEGCPGAHTAHTHNGTAYTRGTYSRVHTQTPTNTNKHAVNHNVALTFNVRAGVVR